MHLTLSWDLLVIIFFAIITAYSFIVGRDAAVKIIIATYIAIVAVQGTGNLLTRIAQNPLAGLQDVDLSASNQWMALTKIVLLVAVILFLALRGGFDMHYVKDIPGIWDTLLTGVFGFATAGLVLSTLLTYIAGRPILDIGLATAPPLSPLLEGSTLISVLVEQQDLWFTLPALLLLGMGFFNSGDENES